MRDSAWKCVLGGPELGQWLVFVFVFVFVFKMRDFAWKCVLGGRELGRWRDDGRITALYGISPYYPPVSI